MPTLQGKMGNIEYGVMSPLFISYSNIKMAIYRRMYVPGETYFLTLVTYQQVIVWQEDV